jgi:hypothetical protein
MAFRFAFDVGEPDEGSVETRDEDMGATVPDDFIPAERLEITTEAVTRAVVTEKSQKDSIIVGRQRFQKRKFLGESTTLSGLVEKSDLEAGLYEGGFKVWECAVDMLQYLDKHFPTATDSLPIAFSDANAYSKHATMTDLHAVPSSSLAGKRVADIGCGHGIPGISCLQRGASFVAFQDLNDEVLWNCTLPNLVLNAPASISSSFSDSYSMTSGLYAGDWRDGERLSALMRAGGTGGLSLFTLYLYSSYDVLH